jgi:hypothetical protein
MRSLSLSCAVRTLQALTPTSELAEHALAVPRSAEHWGTIVTKLLGMSVVLGVLVALSPLTLGTIAGLVVASAVASVAVRI